MFFAFLLALIAIGVGYYIHQQFSPARATPEVSIPGVSKRENVAASKRDIPSVDNTAANETPLQSAIGGTQALETGDKSAAEQPQGDESSRDVKTARSPNQAEHLSYAAVAAGAAPTDAKNNTVQLVKDSEGGSGAATDPASPVFKTAVIPTEAERFGGEYGSLPDSTARNSSPISAASNLEVKHDPETNSALSEKKKEKKRSSGAKKIKTSKKSKEIKSDGGVSD